MKKSLFISITLLFSFFVYSQENQADIKFEETIVTFGGGITIV
jgi:hypothetical protein